MFCAELGPSVMAVFSYYACHDCRFCRGAAAGCVLLHGGMVRALWVLTCSFWSLCCQRQIWGLIN
jgi:hypothetical protein